MLFPYADDNPTERTPLVTIGIIGMNVLVFLGINFVTNLFLGMDALRARAADQGGVAYLAHLGGYAAGFCGVFLLTSPRDWFRGSREVA